MLDCVHLIANPAVSARLDFIPVNTSSWPSTLPLSSKPPPHSLSESGSSTALGLGVAPAPRLRPRPLPPLPFLARPSPASSSAILFASAAHQLHAPRRSPPPPPPPLSPARGSISPPPPLYGPSPTFCSRLFLTCSSRRERTLWLREG